MRSPSLGTAEWYSYLAALFCRNGADTIPQNLGRALQYLSRADSILIMVYFPDKRPALLYADIDHKCRKNNFTEYLQGFYLLDPFYQRAVGCAESTLFHLKDICENSFYDSEYYESWYKQSGLRDEINYLVPLDGAAVMAISLSRNLESAFFSAGEIAQLEVIRPLVGTVVKDYWREIQPRSGEEEGRETGIHEALCRAMENFGSSLLTGREREIVQLLLRGYGIKATASKLDIAPTTIKVHRKNIYKKLDITSHSELFSLFIDALSVVSGDSREDPLLRYTQRMNDA